MTRFYQKSLSYSGCLKRRLDNQNLQIPSRWWFRWRRENFEEGRADYYIALSLYLGLFTRRGLWGGLLFAWLVVYGRLSNFFSNLAAVTITGDRGAYLNLYLALMIFRFEGSFTCHTCCDAGSLFIGLMQRTSPHVPQRDSNPRRKGHQIFTSPLYPLCHARIIIYYISYNSQEGENSLSGTTHRKGNVGEGRTDYYIALFPCLAQLTERGT
jgi:hypothetical protein